MEVEGTPFAYREVGPTTGVPVVFLHHFTAVLDDWDPAVVDGIAAERRVILVDLRGVGGSGGTTPAVFADMSKITRAGLVGLFLAQPVGWLPEPGADVCGSEGEMRSGSARLATGGCSAAMAAKSWMSRLRLVASQARQTWLGGMSLTWL